VAEYRFLTTWCVGAPLDRVWDTIHDFERWPEWWRGVESVEVVGRGGDDGVGNVSRHVWRSRLPYPVRFDIRTTRVERPHLIEGTATGELAGEGRWRLFEAAGATAALYEWNVRTMRPWMNLVAPFARPVFAWNHDWVMRQGGEGLARRLGVPLLSRN
jgi:hypothetical protein